MTKLPHTITTLIEIAFNRYLDMDPDARARMPAMADKVIKITIREIDLPLIMRVRENHIDVLSSYDSDVHSEMRASALSLMKLGMAGDASTSALGEDIEMSGDLETGRQFRDLLSKVDIDWEEILSQYTGDIIAHKIGNSIRTLTNWGRKTVDSLAKDVSEYLQEESRQIPSQHEIIDYLAKIDDIRLAADRAEARVKQLEILLQKAGSDVGEASD
ncbi:ubiquinone biosynthesis accessory factor UbiJ [Kaarinaea lacus]